MQKNKSNTTLLIDIGTASVGGALFSISAGHAPRLCKVLRVPIGNGTETSRDTLLEYTEAAMKKLMEAYAREMVHRVHIVVSSPWHETHIRTITSSTERPAPVSEKNILRAVSRYQNEKPPLEGNNDIEAVAMRIQVNGYGTALKEHVAGTHLDINFYESEMNDAIQKRFSAPIESAFPHSSIAFNTFPLVSMIALRTILPENNFVVLDIAGEMTELSIVHEDGIRHLASFPIGFFTLARAIASRKDAVGDALSRLALLARGELSEEENARVTAAFEKAFLPWREAFENALRSASEHSPIPQTLYVLSDKEHAVWLKKGIEQKNTFNMSITVIDTPLVQPFVELGDKGSYDIFLSLFALFFHTKKTELIGEAQEQTVIYSR